MNLNQKFAILFWLKKDKTNKLGLAPIWTRITIDGQRAEFSTNKQIYPKCWDAENMVALKEFSEAKPLNDFLTMMKADLFRHYNILLSTKDVVTAEDVKKTFFDLYNQYLQQLSERKEIEDLSEGRHKRFEILKGKCEEFVGYKFKRSDVLLDEMKLNFIVEFEHYLRTVQKIGHNTSMKYAKELKQVMKYGVILQYRPIHLNYSSAHTKKSSASSWIRMNWTCCTKRNSP